MIRAIDHWIGKTLFVPIIIRVCQKAGITQYAFHNYGYLIWSYLILSAALNTGKSIGLALFVATFFTVLVGLNPAREGAPSPFMRGWWLILETIHIIAHVTGDKFLFADANWDMSCPATMIALFAEYARTIKTIPPLEAKVLASKRLIEAKAKTRG